MLANTESRWNVKCRIFASSEMWYSPKLQGFWQNMTILYNPVISFGSFGLLLVEIPGPGELFKKAGCSPRSAIFPCSWSCFGTSTFKSWFLFWTLGKVYNNIRPPETNNCFGWFLIIYTIHHLLFGNTIVLLKKVKSISIWPLVSRG